MRSIIPTPLVLLVLVSGCDSGATSAESPQMPQPTSGAINDVGPDDPALTARGGTVQSEATVDVIPPFVILIGGIDSDPSPEQIAGTAARGYGNCGPYQLCSDLLAEGYRAEYFNWNGTRAGEIDAESPLFSTAIVECIRSGCKQHPDAPVVIVGNSWGGHTAWEVCQALSEETAVDVDLVVFLDPSSLGRSAALRPESLPECIRSAVTYFTHNAGGWGAWDDEPRIENIDLGDSANGYLAPGGPEYDSVFSITAHIAAEWDERIHRDIRERIAKVASAE